MTEAQALALADARGLAATPSQIDRLAQAHGAELARWAVTQWALRERARAKFARAAGMLFDREGLEMATHEDVAWRCHLVGEPGERVADLTCGIGADLCALAADRQAIGFEIDPGRAAYARHNVAAHGLAAEVRLEDCLSARWDFQAAFADPARRGGGRRTLSPEAFAPPLSTLARRMSELRHALIKLSPMLDDATLDALSPDRTFVSHAGECKEALLALGRIRARKGVWAYQVESDLWLEGEARFPPRVDRPLAWVGEADPAAIRAHALGSVGGSALGDSNGYLTSALPIHSPWVRALFAVRWEGPWRPDAVVTALRLAGARVVAVKSRGVHVDVGRAADRVQAEGARPLTLLLYPVGRSVRAALGERA